MEEVPYTRQAAREALELAGEILSHLERSDAPLNSIAMMASRVARLVNDVTYHQIFLFEAQGYPTTPEGVEPRVFSLARTAGRVYSEKQKSQAGADEYAYLESVGQLEETIDTAKRSLAVAADPPFSVSTAYADGPDFRSPVRNAHERDTLRSTILSCTGKLESRRAFIYNYILNKYYELKFSGIADDIFIATVDIVRNNIGKYVPNSLQKIDVVYEYLRTENPENWANAVHSCRRILQDLADALFPPTDQPRQLPNGKTIELGPDKYINRLMAFIQDHAGSQRFQDIVGSQLSFIGERLDSVFKAAQKGSHASVSKAEADRYVIYTYLLVGDILSLLPPEV